MNPTTRPLLMIPAFFFATAAALAEPTAPSAPAAAEAEPLPAPQVPPQANTPTRDTAPETTSDDTGRAHGGFYAGLSIGGGARSLFVNGPANVSVDGNGVAAAIRIGGAAAPNLILHGTAFGAATDDPELSVENTTVVADGARVLFTGVGPGFTLYFMPANVYLGGSILVAQTKLELNGEELAKSEWGAGAELRIGKEFWIGPSALLGIGIQGFAAKMSDQNTTDTMKAQAVNLFVDVTYD